jgi:hypothetical protein
LTIILFRRGFNMAKITPDALKLKKYTPPEIKEVWDEQIGTRGVYLLELG